jgi:hypothetical protein
MKCGLDQTIAHHNHKQIPPFAILSLQKFYIHEEEHALSPLIS